MRRMRVDIHSADGIVHSSLAGIHMRLLITGGTGFIGSNLALQARALGHEVIAAGLGAGPVEAARVAALEAAGVGVRLGELEALIRDPQALAGVEIVVHLAAAQHEMNVPDAHFTRVNVEATSALLEAARRSGVRRLVHGSTIGVYGSAAGRLSEADATAPDNVYGRSKLEAERRVLAAGAGIETVVVRISETYGPGDRRLLKLFKAIRQGRFVTIGDGANLHHPIYVDDLVAGLLLAAVQPAAAGEVLLLAGKEVVSTDAMVAAVAAAVGRPAPRRHLPLAPFTLVAGVLEGMLRPLGIQPPLHRRRLDFFVKSFSLDGRKAEALLGFVPQVGFREGAQKTARWYEETGLLGIAEETGPTLATGLRAH